MEPKQQLNCSKKYSFDRDCLLISFGGLGSAGNPAYPKQILKEWPEARFYSYLDTGDMDAPLPEPLSKAGYYTNLERSSETN
jgi:hypothetical protein